MIIKPDRDTMTALCETDLYTFYREAWPVIVPGEPFQDNWHIGAVCEHLEALARREFDKLLINIPPRHGKSDTCSVALPAWLWIRDPAMRMIYASYSGDFAMRDSRATHRLITSEWYQSRWGDRFALAADADAQRRFENDKSGFRIATSPGGMGTGEGGDLICVDDPHKTDEVDSEVTRQSVLDWWNVTMSSRTGRYGSALRLVVMQRLHEMDLSGDLIEKGYVHLCIPQEYEPNHPHTRRAWGGWTDPRKEEGELLWPARFSREKIDATQKPPHMSTYVYAGHFQQRPAPAEGGMFQRKWWKLYKWDALIVESLIERADDKCWSWDMAFKDLKSSDYVCGGAVVRIAADFYILPSAVNDHLGFNASKTAVKTGAAKYPRIHYKLVEDKANGTAIIEDLKRTVGGLTPIEPQGGKEARASVVQPYAEAGNIWLPEGASWVEDFIEEHRVFNKGAHDDWVDMLSQAVVWMLERMAKGFAPFSWAVNRSTSQSTGPPRVPRDPRERSEDVPAGYSERGDMRPAKPHDVGSAAHRTECRACRAKFRAPAEGVVK